MIVFCGWNNRLILSYQMKNRFKKTVEMEKMHYLGGEDIDDDAKKEKIDAMKLKINRMGTSLMMIQYLSKYWYQWIFSQISYS